MNSLRECDKPKWLTLDYVEKIVYESLKDTWATVESFDIQAATAKGESYSSVINRVKVVYTTPKQPNPAEMSFLVKTTFESNEFLASVLEKYDVLNTEMEIYEQVLPKMQKLLEGIEDKDQLFARTLHVDYERKAIFFEDLSVKGFVMANRLQGLDETHVKLCLRKLAKFHATAAVLNDRLDGQLEKYQRGIFNRHVNEYGQFFERVFKVCAEFCRACPELGDYYGDKLERLIPHVVENTTRCYDTKEGHFHTLNHGDMWTNNVMVQYEGRGGEGKVISDALLIDFQYCNWTSPAVDLFYFFSSSLQDDLIFNGRDELVQYYHGILSQTLKNLNYIHHIPTLHELHVQLLERGFKTVTSQLVNMPVMINDKTEDADFECFLRDNEKSRRFCRVLYTNERVQRIVKIMLPRWDRLGFLDMLE